MLCYTAYFDFVVSVDGELLGLELLGLELLEEAPPLLDWSLEPDALGVEDELEELGELGVDAPEELEELGELGVVLNEPLALPLEESRLELELEPDGEDGDVPDAPLEEPERDAPGPLALSHP
jgi:hypothetical protein